MNAANSLVALALAFALMLVGVSMLMLWQPRNWRKVTGEASSSPAQARLGWLLVMAAYVPCALCDGAGFAFLLWPLIFALAAFGIAIILSFSPRVFRSLARLLKRNSPLM